MKALQIQLDDSELQTLFQILDKTGKGTITYDLFVSEFPEINSKLLKFRSHLLINLSNARLLMHHYSYIHDQQD
jgi:hypothetical protein